MGHGHNKLKTKYQNQTLQQDQPFHSWWSEMWRSFQ